VRVVREAFEGDALDRGRWSPSYLPAWASRAENAATYRLTAPGLVLEIPREQGLWSAAEHRPPLRTSTIASGDWSGPVGSARGPQPFRDGLLVREEQPRFRGWLTAGGFVEIRCRMSLDRRSMASLWLAGWDEDADDGGELCVVEVFGSELRRATDGTPSAAVGLGVKAKTDPRLRDEFLTARLPIDVAKAHDYRVDWDEREATFAVDGEVVHRCPAPPRYPLVLMLGVFDFPDGTEPVHVPALEVEHVVGTAID
jgi:hypothetical protein